MLPYEIVDAKCLDDNFQQEMGCFEWIKMKSKRGKISHHSIKNKSKPLNVNGQKYINNTQNKSLDSFTILDVTRINNNNNNNSADSNNDVQVSNNSLRSSDTISSQMAGSNASQKSDTDDKSVQMEMLNAGTLGSLFGSISSTKLLATVADDSGKAVEDAIYHNFEFPFTNLILEGGGNKGMAYVGALKVLEEAGIARKIRRFAGASVGAITAALLAVGFTSSELEEFMDADLRKVLVDHRCGYLSLLPNLLSGFGWNPGKRLYKWFGEQLKERTGNGDITFREVYDKYGRELCIVVTNLSQMSTEYFHPKTTPNTPIRTAVRMSAALPGVFQSVRYRLNEDISDVFVDGGLLCNYPIHAFDGWWLSMDPKDTFFKRLQPFEQYAKFFEKSERFGTWNSNSLGIMLYSHTETELMKAKLAERQGNGPPPPPNTKLYRKRKKTRIKQIAATKEHEAVVKALGRFMKELHRMQYDLDGIVSLPELEKVFQKSNEFTKVDQELLFGDKNINEAFAELDRDDDGEITFQELMTFMESKGINVQTRFLGYARKEIKTLMDFISTLQTALSINVKRNYVEDRDIERTIGIDTDYIEAGDFYLEDADKVFLKESGARAARAFLRHYCKENPHHRRRVSAMVSRGFEYQRISEIVPQHFPLLVQPYQHSLSNSNEENNLIIPPTDGLPTQEQQIDPENQYLQTNIPDEKQLKGKTDIPEDQHLQTKIPIQKRKPSEISIISMTVKT